MIIIALYSEEVKKKNINPDGDSKSLTLPRRLQCKVSSRRAATITMERAEMWGFCDTEMDGWMDGWMKG